MPDLPTIVKGFLSISILTGTGILAMGLGFIDIDAKLEGYARIYLDAFQIATKPFLISLGSTKVLSALKLWGIGPMPTSLVPLGLGLPALCGSYAHFKMNEGPPTVFAVTYCVALGWYWNQQSKPLQTKKE